MINYVVDEEEIAQTTKSLNGLVEILTKNMNAEDEFQRMMAYTSASLILKTLNGMEDLITLFMLTGIRCKELQEEGKASAACKTWDNAEGHPFYKNGFEKQEKILSAFNAIAEEMRKIHQKESA